MSTFTNENPTPLDSAGWELTYFDGFDGAYLDRAAWPIVFNGGTYWNGAFEWRQENVVVWDGEVTVNSIASPQGWTSGGLNMGWNGQLYGRWEVRARLDEGKGTSAAILLWPTDGEYPPEIDLLESPDPERQISSMTVHSEGQHEGYQALSDASEWHTYAVDWLPDRITFYIDGVEAWTTTNRVPSEPMALGFMGFVASAEDEWFGGAPDASTPGVVGLHVDWVRIWTPEELYPGEAPPALYGDDATGWGAAPETVRTGVRSLGEDRFAANWNGGEWGSVAGVRVDAGTSWAPGIALQQIYANYEQVELDLRAAPSAVTLNVIGAATGSARFGAANDTLTWLVHADAASVDKRPNIMMGAGDDTVLVTAPSADWIAMPFGWGGRWNGRYDGGLSIVSVSAEGGNDRVVAEAMIQLAADGGTGNDVIIGAGGGDTIRGGVGVDDLTGGAGADQFIYVAGEGGDTIRDFQVGIDRLVLSGISEAGISMRAASGGLSVLADGEVLATLQGVSALTAGDIVFGQISDLPVPEAPPSPVVTTPPPPVVDPVPDPTPAPAPGDDGGTTGILYLTSAADRVTVTNGLVVEGFQAGTDKLLIPTGVAVADLRVFADLDWAHGGDAWGQRVSYGGGDVFLRYSWDFNAQRDAISSVQTSAPPPDVPDTTTPTIPAPTDQDAILMLTSAADRVQARPGLSVESFAAGIDKLVLPTGTNLTSVQVSADFDWARGADAWGQRVSYDGGDVFLRYSWDFDAQRDIAVATSSDLVF